MIEKLNTDGANTFLTKEPIIFNGVKLPKGALMKKTDGGGWTFLRLTPFTFDTSKDQLAFGSEISKAVRGINRMGRYLTDLAIRLLLL